MAVIEMGVICFCHVVLTSMHMYVCLHRQTMAVIVT